MRSRAVAIAALQLACLALSAPLPSCDDETEAHCVGEDADLSPEGINKARCARLQVGPVCNLPEHAGRMHC